MMEAAILAALMASPDIAKMVGTRIRWDSAISSWSRPYIILQQISDESIESHEGPCGLAFAMVQINCVADQPGLARNLRQTVIRWFGNYSGEHEGCEIRVIVRGNRFPVFETVTSGNGEPTRTAAVEYKVAYSDVIPLVHT